jgi:hypothetical protein
MADRAIEAAQRAFLIRLLDEAYRRKSWHGSNLRGALSRVSAEAAGWRPRPGRKNIGEIAVHCAYWKYTVRRRIRGDKRGSFVLKGSNWFALPGVLTERQWKEYLKLLDTEHHLLRETIEGAPWKALTGGAAGGGTAAFRIAPHVHGIAMHDLYHTGQIQTLKALYKQARSIT